jgi:hypothetical protein
VRVLYLLLLNVWYSQSQDELIRHISHVWYSQSQDELSRHISHVWYNQSQDELLRHISHVWYSQSQDELLRHISHVWHSQSQDELLRHISHEHALTQPANSPDLSIAVFSLRHQFQFHQTFVSVCNAVLFSDQHCCPILMSRQNLSLFLTFAIFTSLAAGSCPKFALSAEPHFQQLLEAF